MSSSKNKNNIGSDGIVNGNLFEQLDLNEDDVLVCCANCGKDGSGINNTCNKCKVVKYCNAACKKKHRSKHKEECEKIVKRAAEIQAELHDEKLFKQPPPKEDCPICMLPLPPLVTGWVYMACCGKVICCGCCYAPMYDNLGNEISEEKCPFCRTPFADSNEEVIERNKKRMEADDANAIHSLGTFYRGGDHGLPQDYDKAFELFDRAGELGCVAAYNTVGVAYCHGRGVERDEKKAKHYYELAAIGGDVYGRYNLGLLEAKAGNLKRALKHFMIAAGSGYNNALKEIQKLFLWACNERGLYANFTSIPRMC